MITSGELNDQGPRTRDTVWQIVCDLCRVAGPLEFQRSEAIAQARHEGWTVNDETDEARCGRCMRGRRPPRVRAARRGE